MDNLGSHKRHAIRRLIRAVGAKLFFLPPYSPGLPSARLVSFDGVISTMNQSYATAAASSRSRQ
jgi:hypothetical protein